MAAAFEWIAFVVLSLIAIAGALGMTTTMSMFRSGIFLMSSFVGVAGLFILLGADLIGMLQVMMYVGGMLVMILFMVLFSSDPGGAMMTSHMKLPLVERMFSRGLAHEQDDDDRGDEGEQENGDEGGHEDMSMFTPLKKAAAVLAAVTGLALVAMITLHRPWTVSGAQPDPRSAERIGELLMGKYMIAFEGAGLLILLGIFGAVYLQRPGRHPDPSSRERLEAAVDEPPAPIAAEPDSDEQAREAAE